ncbi:MAG: transposase [Bdellovibrionales bacterium]|nr:transposase [Bdellovibrionales bacterium]
MNEVWQIFSTHIPFLKFAFNFDIHAFVLMNNHYHLIASTPDWNLSDGMSYFQREISRELNRQGNRINRNFAGRYFKCNLKNSHHFLNCYKYVYQNPLRAGIVSRCELYPFSALHEIIGYRRTMIPIFDDQILFEPNLDAHLKWLNTLPLEEDVNSIRLALKKGVYNLRKNPSTKKPNRLEEGLL